MQWRQLSKSLLGWLRPSRRSAQPLPRRGLGAVTHVIILDGTASSLVPGRETNAGRIYRLLSRIGAPVSLYYEAGVQWRDWRSSRDVMMGRGINRQIRRAYGYLASRYRPGDKIYLFGYSRGAFAVRSLAGVIDRVGLLRDRDATERNVMLAYRHYQSEPGSRAARIFSERYCHDGVEIEMIGAFDTVKALGLRLPVLWRYSEPAHQFHNHALGPAVKRGFHAIALNENREVFDPVMWRTPEGFEGHVEQVWFPGAHGDIGGQLDGFDEARPLANIPLVWMLEKAEESGLPLPVGWRANYPCDPGAPSIGTWRSWAKFFLSRKRRVVGRDPSERLHETVAEREMALGRAQQEPV